MIPVTRISPAALGLGALFAASLSIGCSPSSASNPCDSKARAARHAKNSNSSAPSLGSAQDFTVLAATTVTSPGPSIVSDGDLGLSPGTSVTGFPPSQVLSPGTMHITDVVAKQAQSDATNAYVALAAAHCTFDETTLGGDFSNVTLVPGVYCFGSGTMLSTSTGTLTFDGKSDPNAVFIFQFASSMLIPEGTKFLYVNGASGCNVYWQVTSSATIGDTVDFPGTVVAQGSITDGTGTAGRLIALTGAVTLNASDVGMQCKPASSDGGTVPDGGIDDGGTDDSDAGSLGSCGE